MEAKYRLSRLKQIWICFRVQCRMTSQMEHIQPVNIMQPILPNIMVKNFRISIRVTSRAWPIVINKVVTVLNCSLVLVTSVPILSQEKPVYKTGSIPCTKWTDNCRLRYSSQRWPLQMASLCPQKSWPSSVNLLWIAAYMHSKSRLKTITQLVVVLQDQEEMAICLSSRIKQIVQNNIS